MFLTATFFALLFAQAESPVPEQTPQHAEIESSATPVRVTPGTKIPLSLLNSISTKNAIEGDRVYLETIFPIIVNGQITIPVGSSVAGTVTSVKRAGRIKGKAELFVRFDSLILPNGVMRDFRSRMSNVDGTNPGKLDRDEGKIEGDGNKSGDMRSIGDAAMAGTIVGAISGAAAAGRPGMGAGIGAAAGATAAMIGILATRGPDAVLTKGTTVEMVLDRELIFEDEELNFQTTSPMGRRTGINVPQPQKKNERPGWRQPSSSRTNP